ncbi:MAG: DUF3854 domain-containing protein [Symploca sp. SIO2E9]|nr:DUF3854 domain-containing protein [Symploca sp. SIO2E9]
MKEQSTPSIDQLCETDLAELKSSGLSAQQISKLGHFTVDDVKLAKKQVGFKHTGLVFSYFNPLSGQPYLTSKGRPYYRIKPRDWASSALGDPPKYLSPHGEGNKPYWSRLLQQFSLKAQKTSIPLHIVEGEKKADSLAAENFLVLGLSGVWGWLDKTTRLEEIDLPPAQLIEDDEEAQKDLTDKKLEESRLLPEIVESINWQHRPVYISFDSDLWQKPGVEKAARSLAEALNQLGAKCHFVILPSEINGEKNGVDDFKVRHGIEAYAKLCRLALPKLENKDPFPLYKIMLCWSVLKDCWRFRAGMGWYFWQGDCWKIRSDCEFESSLIEFFDQQQWLGTKGLDTLIRQLRSRLLVYEKFWNPKNKLTFSNGTLNLNTNEFASHCRGDFITQVLPYEYDTTAVCPQWQKFLLEAVGGDTEAVELLRAFIKWILLPKDRSKKYPIEKALDLLGPKGSGKGTFLDALMNVVGSESTGTFDSASFQSPNSLTQLLDKKIAVDADSFGRISDVGQFNKIVSNEPVLVKKLYKDMANARLGTVIVRAYNRVPEVPDGSEGLDRRVIVVSFNNRPRSLDLDLPQKLSLETPGIFQWAWSMPFNEVKRRIYRAGEVKSVAVASTKRFEINNPEYVFLVEVFGEGNRVKVGDFYASYLDWCKENGLGAKKRRKLMEAVSAFGVTSKKSTGGIYFASVPKMSDFDLITHLGINKNLSAFEKTLTPFCSTYSTSPESARVSGSQETPLTPVTPLSETPLIETHDSGENPPPTPNSTPITPPSPTYSTHQKPDTEGFSCESGARGVTEGKTFSKTNSSPESLPAAPTINSVPETHNSGENHSQTQNSTPITPPSPTYSTHQKADTEGFSGESGARGVTEGKTFLKTNSSPESLPAAPKHLPTPDLGEAPPEPPYQLGCQYLMRRFADTTIQNPHFEWVRATLVGFEDPPFYTKFIFELADGSNCRKYNDEIESLPVQSLDLEQLQLLTRLLIEDEQGRFLQYELIETQANQFFRLKSNASQKPIDNRLWSRRELIEAHAVIKKPEPAPSTSSFSPGDCTTFSRSEVPTNGVVKIIKLLDGLKALCQCVNDRFITLELNFLKPSSPRKFKAERQHFLSFFGGNHEPEFS